ncbi:transglutaminase-like domain-containing protein [bacterium]|nr:transglutaminase-like domain-containing protein [bacterium]
MFIRFLNLILLFLLLLPHLNVAAENKTSYPPEVVQAFAEAGDNLPEFEKVLTHYASEDDSLKLQSAYYLIGNMEGHCYVTFKLCDTAGTELDFNVLNYPDYAQMIAAYDSLESLHGELDFQKKEKIEDLHSITADFLIHQIDYAFKAWHEKPWAKDLSFDAFREYVLPYRGSEEPLENWREFFYEKYKDLASNMTDPSDPIEAVTRINDDIKSWFSFDSRYYYHPTDQGLSEMLTNRMGRCEDMTNLTIYAMRANGLAVTSDYTPYWANSGNNHAWNTVLTPDGKMTLFMGAESNPGNYRLANKVAKVYRKTFGKQKDNLAFRERKQEKMPKYLSGKSYKDVTADYTEVRDVQVTFEKTVPDTVDIAYLCVFNSGEWKAIDWGRIEDGEVDFTDAGTNIAYLPGLYVNEEIVPFGNAFILHSNGSTQELLPEKEKTIDVKLTSTTLRKQGVSTDGIVKAFFTPGRTYELFYWDDGWQSHDKSVAADKPLVFENVPAGCLYWLVEEDSDREERIFTIENHQQIWW